MSPLQLSQIHFIIILPYNSAIFHINIIQPFKLQGPKKITNIQNQINVTPFLQTNTFFLLNSIQYKQDLQIFSLLCNLISVLYLQNKEIQKNINTKGMDQHSQSYCTLLRTFYTKIMETHPQRVKLCRQFENMIIELDKKPLHKNLSRKLLKKGSDFSAPEKDTNSGSLASISKKINSSKLSKINELYCHCNFGFVFAFSYIYLLIDIQSQEMLRMMDAKTKLLLDTDFNKNKIKDQSKWEQSLMEWKKIMNLLEHKNVVNWQRILRSSFSVLEENLVSIIIRTILNLNINASTQLQVKTETFYKICQQIKISLLFFELEGDQVRDKQVYGRKYKNTMKIGYIKAKNIYASYDKLPQEEAENEYLLTPPSLRRKQTQKILTSASNKQISISESYKLQIKAYTYKKHENSKKQTELSNKKFPILEKTLLSRSPKNILSYTLLKRKVLMNVQFIKKQFEQHSKYFQKLQCLVHKNRKSSTNDGSQDANQANTMNISSRISKK